MKSGKIIVWFGAAVILAAMLLVSCDSSTEPEVIDNRAPSVPILDVSLGCPEDQSTGQSITPTLRWTCTDPDDDALTYDIYLGLATDSQLELTSASQTENYFTTDTLLYEHTYQWQVCARDEHGATTISPEWSFTVRGVDHTPPSVYITSPGYGDEVDSTITIIAEASDNYAVMRVEFYVGGTLHCTDYTPPWSCTWSTGVYLDSTDHEIYAVAYDDAGYSDISAVVTVTVVNMNAPPQTYLYHTEAYFNAIDETAAAPGIYLGWSASDQDGTMPPAEYEWRLYGPFDTLTYIPIKYVLENGQLTALLDLDNLPPAQDGLPQPLMHSRGPDYDSDPSDVWVNQSTDTLYDVFKDLAVDTSGVYKFAFWVRVRDEMNLPDQTPAFGEFFVYDARFERDVAVFDETGYTNQQGRWAPRSLDTVKSVLRRYIHGAGYTDFDTTSGVDFFHTTIYKDAQRTPIDKAPPSLMDVLSHRIIIMYSDDVSGSKSELPDYGLRYWAFLGLDAGASVWMMSRNLGGANQNTEPGEYLHASHEFQNYFGIEFVMTEAWFHDLIIDFQNPVFNEQFIGASPSVGDYPSLNVDFTLLDSRYPRMVLDTAHVMLGLPEVGIAGHTSYPEPVFTYVSRHGGSSAFHGSVCGVRQVREGMRSACWLFTPTAIQSDAMQQAFTTTLTWLTAPGKAATAAEISQRRERIVRFLEGLWEGIEAE